MPAADEFPRGWTVTNTPAGGVNAVIVLAALAGIARVITGIQAQIQLAAAAAVPFRGAITIASSDGSIPTQTLAFLMVDTAPEHDTYEWSGKLAASSGATVTITVASEANGQAQLELQGYDI